MAFLTRPRLTVALAMLALCSSAAQAQWMWPDAQGRRVYSDRPPPSDIPERSVLRSPAPRTEPAANAAGTAGAATNTNAAPPAAAASAPGRDPALEARKREQEQAEAKQKQAEDDKRKAEDARAAAQRADNCNRVRQSIAVLQSGQRMRVPQPNGEMGFMSDEQRAAEFQRLQQMLATECRG